ncbi:MAG: hypothetical protein ABII71_02935 [Candidatus Micrarchaeota archaeon]
MDKGRKLMGEEIAPKKQRNSLGAGRLLKTVILSLGFSGCAHQESWPTSPGPHQSRPAVSQSEQSAGNRILTGRIGEGECRLNVEERKLTYVGTGRTVSIAVDSAFDDATEISCTQSYSLIRAPGRIIVVLGMDDALAGRRMLGSIAGGFLISNAYTVNIRDAEAQGITNLSVEGSRLRIETERARWELDLASPLEWLIY